MENEKIITDTINILADKLGTTGQHLWGVLMKQAFYSSVIDLITFIILCIATGVCAKISTNCWKKSEEKDEFIAAAILTLIVAGIGLIFCFFGVADMSTWLSGLYNPEYWALNQVMSIMKP